MFQIRYAFYYALKDREDSEKRSRDCTTITMTEIRFLWMDCIKLIFFLRKSQLKKVDRRGWRYKSTLTFSQLESQYTTRIYKGQNYPIEPGISDWLFLTRPQIIRYKISNILVLYLSYTVFPKSTGPKALSSKNLSSPVYYTMSLDQMSSMICQTFSNKC